MDRKIFNCSLLFAQSLIKACRVSLKILASFLFPAIVLALCLPSHILAQEVRQIDAFKNYPTRYIDDFVNGGKVELEDSEVIDIIILGDGYIVDDSTGTDETDDFFQDARVWYDRVLDYTSVPNHNGVRPYTMFRPAFRVWAVFNASTERASHTRGSYYKVKLEANDESVAKDGWPQGTIDQEDIDFRDNVFAAVDGVTPINMAKYPANLISSPYAMANVHSNLFVVMLVLRPDNKQGGGRADTIGSNSEADRFLRIAIGKGWEHEFGHAFGLVKDEYIAHPGATDTTSSNPAPEDRSVFNLSNLTYSNARYDLYWSHLAPGGQYNRNYNSLIGNLFMGGDEEFGVWHSEYICLMNGSHWNFFCEKTEIRTENDVYLRDEFHFCSWCQEIVAIRILERTGQLLRKDDVTVDINKRGKIWFQRWQNSLRALYYDHFNVEDIIAERNACYDYRISGIACPAQFPDCQNACSAPYIEHVPPTESHSQWPSCLRGCGIREIGNAMYVDSSAGSFQDGSKLNPFSTISEAINKSKAPHLIVIKPGIDQETPVSFDSPSIWIPYGCDDVFLGN